MKRSVVPLFAAVIGLVFGSATIQANPCICPKRMVRGQTVDLRPLMNWWQEPKGMRPLSAWKHVRGTIARDRPYGWVIEVRHEGDGHAERFFLKDPPRDRLQRFQELQKELAEYKETSVLATEVLSRPVYTDWYSYYLTPWTGPALSLAEYRNAEATLLVIQRKMAAISDELATMQDTLGEFEVDAFALKCDESFEGLPVYDYGSTAPFGY